MRNKYRAAAKDNAMPMGLLKGALAGIISTLVGTAAMSWLIIREVLKETSIGYCAMGVILLSAFIAAFAAIKAVKSKLAYVSVLSGLIYFTVLMGANALFFKGTYQAVGVTSLLVLAGSGGAMLLSGGVKKRRGTPRRKIRHA